MRPTLRLPTVSEGCRPCRGRRRVCCNGSHIHSKSMGAAIYLALMGGGIVTALALALVLRGIKLI